MTRNLRLAALLVGMLAVVVAVPLVERGEKDAAPAGEREVPPRAPVHGGLALALGDVSLAPGDVSPALGKETLASAGAWRAVPAEALRATPCDERFRGRILDLATDEPVGRVRLVLLGDARPGPRWTPELAPAPAARAPKGIAVADDGRFVAGEPFPAETTELAVLNPLQGTHVRTLRRDALEPDGDEGWLARIAIGPTFRFDPLGVARFDAAAWEARLVEVAADGVEHEGSWLRIQPARAPWIRYDDPWQPNRAGSGFRVDLRERGGARMGSSALFDGSAVGVHPNLVAVPVDRIAARLLGRVVDTAGRPKEHVSVQAAPVGAAPSGAPARRTHDARTDGDGRFELAGLELGEVLLTARPRRGEPPVARAVLIDRERVDIGELVVARHDGSGMVSGRLESKTGVSLAAPERVRLRALDGRGIELLDVSWEGRSGWHAGGSHAFEFNEAPAGELELSVVSQDGYRWLPETLRVTAPASGVVFVRQDDVPSVSYAFDVVRAEDGAPVHVYEVVLEVVGSPARTIPCPRCIDLKIMEQGGVLPSPLPGEPAWVRALRVPAGSSFRWTIRAPGLRAVTGDARAFRHVVRDEAVTGDDGGPRGGEERETLGARIALYPGFAARLRFRDLGAGYLHDDEHGLVRVLEAPRISGVRIRADGRVVGTSAGGEAWIELDREPARLDVEVPGWRLIESAGFRNGRIIGGAGDVVIWMTRDS